MTGRKHSTNLRRLVIKPASAKSKGRNFQQWVRDHLLTVFLQLEPDDIKSTSMGAGGEDLQLSPAARKLIPYQIECKAKARAQVYTWMEQAKGHGKHEPLVVIKQDRKKPLVVVDAEHFFNMVKELSGNTGQDA
jgi:hypothetical protein